MNIVERNVGDLHPYEKNPRRNDEAVKYVANSIKHFGFKVPLVIDADGVIVAGHTRWKAAKRLKLKTVPCIVADDLTEEQIKAFRLADNKVSEAAEWDFDLLDEEMEGILDFNMADFGFEMESPEMLMPDDEEEEKQNAAERTGNAYNLGEFDEDATEGYFQMPVLHPVSFVPTDMIGFNYAMSSKETDCGIHFYVDDYQFERVWNQPQVYLDILSKYECIFTPDFSLYTEMPIAMKIWNVYRSRLIGQMAQRMGMIVIPTVSWCEEATFDFCFDGLPRNSTLSISTIGVKRNSENFDLWAAGVEEMLQRLEPKTLLIYGGKVDFDYGNTKTIYFENKVTERMKRL